MNIKTCKKHFWMALLMMGGYLVSSVSAQDGFFNSLSVNELQAHSHLDIPSGTFSLGTAQVPDAFNQGSQFTSEAFTMGYNESWHYSSGYNQVGTINIDEYGNYTDPWGNAQSGGFWDHNGTHHPGPENDVPVYEYYSSSGLEFAHINFIAAQENPTWRWLRKTPDLTNYSGYLDTEMMFLDSGGLTINGSLNVPSGNIYGGFIGTPHLVSYSTATFYGQFYGYSQTNSLPNQTLNGGGASILTKTLGDSLYASKGSATTLASWPSSGANLGNGNSVTQGSFGMGMGLQVSSGAGQTQVVLGRFNQTVADAALVVGTGQSNGRINALVVKNNGDAQLRGSLQTTGISTTTVTVTGAASTGSLAVSGATHLSGAVTASGALDVIGDVSAQGTLQVGGNVNALGVIRVMPAGDLSMGGFHRGTRPDGTLDSGEN